MSIEQRAKDMRVSDLVKEIKKLREENEKLKEENGNLKVLVDDLQPNYTNWYNLINWQREDHRKITNRLLINNLILIVTIIVDLFI